MKLSAIHKKIGRNFINIYRESSGKNDLGETVDTLNGVYSNIRALIEVIPSQQGVRNLLTVSGRQYTRYYNIQIWGSDDVDINRIRENDIIEDTSSHKKYEILEIRPGGLNGRIEYKIECECIVADDSRFTNFEEHI